MALIAAAHGHDHVRLLGELVGEQLRLAVDAVEPEFAHDLDHVGMPRSAGSVPAEAAAWRPWAGCSNSACAICERPAL